MIEETKLMSQFQHAADPTCQFLSLQEKYIEHTCTMKTICVLFTSIHAYKQLVLNIATKAKKNFVITNQMQNKPKITFCMKIFFSRYIAQVKQWSCWQHQAIIGKGTPQTNISVEQPLPRWTTESSSQNKVITLTGCQTHMVRGEKLQAGNSCSSYKLASAQMHKQ